LQLPRGSSNWVEGTALTGTKDPSQHAWSDTPVFRRQHFQRGAGTNARLERKPGHIDQSHVDRFPRNRVICRTTDDNRVCPVVPEETSAVPWPLNSDSSLHMFTNQIVCLTVRRQSWLRVGALVLLSQGGCHFRAGFGPAPAGRPSVDHSLVRDTKETLEGAKTTHETDTTTTTFDDGRSTTLETVKVTVIQPDGSTSRNTTETKTERSSNGSVSTSSSSSSSGN
jgi:hypothetical protein